MPWIEFTGEQAGLSGYEALQVYNGLDCCLTAQIKEKLVPQLDTQHAIVYNRALRVQALCLAMSYEALPIDPIRLIFLVRRLGAEGDRLLSIWNRFCEAAGFKEPLNPLSTDQLKFLFFDALGIPPTKKWDPKLGKSKVTLDRKAMEEKLALYLPAAPFVKVNIAIREKRKMLSVFKRGLEPNGRLRCSFNPAGTETGRLSSNQNVFRRGMNAQNVTDALRGVVAVKPPWKMAVMDLEQAESRAVAYLSGDLAYIHACENGDLHTTVTQMVWKNLGWTTDLSTNKSIAEQPFYRHYSYRDMSKRGGHGSNYYGQPPTMAKHLNVEVSVMAEFQRDYFNAFSGIRDWQRWTIGQIMQKRKLITPLLRERTFWNRPDDAKTHREGIAFVPQSLVGDVMNEGLISIAEFFRRERIRATVNLQVHDAGMFIYHEEDEQWLLPEILQRVIFPVEVTDIGGTRRTLTIPIEAKVGWNWERESDTNPLGLRKWKGKETRTWVEEYAPERLLDYKF